MVKPMMKRRVFVLTIVLATLGAGFSAGFFMPRDDEFFALRKNFEIFGALYEQLVSDYVDPLDAERLMRTGIEAMLEDLDPYTNFFDEADNADIEIITRGRYGGVGLNVGIRNGRITVTSPIEGTSGYKQGVRAGDVIVEIAGQPTEGMSMDDVGSLMRGEPGTAVELVVEREGEPEPLRFLLTREQVTLKNVTYSGFVGDDTTGGVGYIKLERFAREAAPEVRRALQQLQQTGRLEGLVLDLRDNPGGLLDAAVDITQLSVPQGSVIVSPRGRAAQSEHVYRSKMPPLAPELPLVVLVNEYSASASEIVAGAVQDLDRGVVLGVPSFGKGLVQIVKPLPYNTSLKLTTSRYYTPSGRSIQAVDYGRHDGNFAEIPDSLRRTFTTSAGRAVRDGNGIEPDVEVSPGEKSDLEQALERRAAFFFYANHYAATHPSLPPGFEVDDAVVADFQRWLDGQGFTYRTDAERSVETLAGDLEKIGYDEAGGEIAALRAAILRGKDDDFTRYADAIKGRLRAEIAARYLGETGQIVASFEHDAQLRRAVALLQDAGGYAGLLAPRR